MRVRHRPEGGLATAAVALVLVAGAVGCGRSGPEPAATTATTTATTAPGPTTTADLSGVQTFTGLGRAHVPGPVDYPQVPPVGGDHAPVWQDCGFYSRPIVTEQGVHSMEHGAAWITYAPDLASGEVAVLKALATSRRYVLVSPFPGLPAPVVASAWGVQLQLPSATDPRLAAFVATFARGRQAPEPGAPCSGGVGTPES